MAVGQEDLCAAARELGLDNKAEAWPSHAIYESDVCTLQSAMLQHVVCCYHVLRRCARSQLGPRACSPS